MLCREIVTRGSYMACGRNAIGYLTFSNDEGETVEMGYCREHANSIRQAAIGYRQAGKISLLTDTLFEERTPIE